MPNVLENRFLYVGIFSFISFALSVPLAIWMIETVGTECFPNGPCVLPVLILPDGTEFLAPSGVVIVGVAFVLRDLVQRYLGTIWAIIAILVGAALSIGFSPAHLVLASTAAFLISELADFAIYTPLHRRRLLLAVLASSMVGLVIDSLVFLWLAFGSLDFLLAQSIGKAWMVLLALPGIYWLRKHEEKLLKF